GREVFKLEFADAALSESDQLRRAGELEADVRKLLGMLSLPGSASGALEIIAVRLGRERSDRRTVPGRIYSDQERQQPDHQRQILRLVGGRFRRGRLSSRFLLFHFPKYAAQLAPRLCDGAPASSSVKIGRASCRER